MERPRAGIKDVSMGNNPAEISEGKPFVLLYAPVKMSPMEAVDLALNPLASNEQLWNAIYAFKDHSTVRKYMLRGVLVNLADIQFDAWGNRNYRNTAHLQEMLAQKDIPVRAVPNTRTPKNASKRGFYRFTFERLRDEAVEAAQDAGPEFKYPTVRQLSGKTKPKDETPTTASLRHQVGYVPLAKALAEQGIKLNKKKREKLFENLSHAPEVLTVFVTGESYDDEKYIEEGKEIVLAEFLKSLDED